MSAYFLQFIRSKYLIWLALAIPAWPFLAEFVYPDRYYPEMMERSGVLSMQLLVLALSITPMVALLKQWGAMPFGALWLLRNRRYVGVASFAYAAIHTLLYLRQISFDLKLAWLEALIWSFGSGWIAVFVLAILAMFSNNWSVRKLKGNWKPIQRFAYLAIGAGFLHWLLLDFFMRDALPWIAVFFVAKTAQIVVHNYFKS